MTQEPKLSKQELEIAMAACCVGTMWDEYEGTEDFDHMVRLRLNHLIELVRKSQPSLPSDLDEAAEEYGRNTFINECIKYGVCDDHDLSDAFKAGAEWMAGQGCTKEETVYFERLCDENRIMVDLGWGEPERGGFNPGDKVIVQIRKKQ